MATRGREFLSGLEQLRDCPHRQYQASRVDQADESLFQVERHRGVVQNVNNQHRRSNRIRADKRSFHAIGEQQRAQPLTLEIALHGEPAQQGRADQRVAW